MEKQINLFKGELLEEKLRMFFLERGYYVTRGSKYKFKTNEITDVDLFLYGKQSTISRERINVDAKNKQKPKSFERILWAKGLQSLLNFENCIVATTDKRDILKEYSKNQNLIILDGNFLSKLKDPNPERLNEEELKELFLQKQCYTIFKNQSWDVIYDKSKSRLLNEMDFSGLNSSLYTLKYFIEEYISSSQDQIALRGLYIIISHTLLILDYILKSIVFQNLDERKEYLKTGLNYGNLGIEGVNKTIQLALKLSNSKIDFKSIKSRLEIPESSILSEYFAKNDINKHLFQCAIYFENYCFNRKLLKPTELENFNKSIISIFLDFFNISRKVFFEEKCEVK